MRISSPTKLFCRLSLFLLAWPEVPAQQSTSENDQSTHLVAFLLKHDFDSFHQPPDQDSRQDGCTAPRLRWISRSKSSHKFSEFFHCVSPVSIEELIFPHLCKSSLNISSVLLLIFPFWTLPPPHVHSSVGEFGLMANRHFSQITLTNASPGYRLFFSDLLKRCRH
jgi:hypothetical protein